jgi:membrane protein
MSTPDSGNHLRAFLKLAAAWARRVVTEPRDELSRWERRARFAYDLVRYGLRKLRRDSATQMAAALSYRTLFSLLPVLVVATMIIRAIGGFRQFHERIAESLGSFGLDEIHVAAGSESALDGGGQTLSAWILALIEEAERVDLTALTWVGAAVLVYSAVSLMVTIEKSFNDIFRAPQGRPWARRLPIYWTLLTLGPVAIGATIYLDNQLSSFLDSMTGFWSIAKILSPLSGFVGTWMVMFAAYKWLPNTHVKFQPALVGALFAALLLEGGKAFLGAYIGHAFSVRHLYGSLGLIPLFMFWVYLMWLLVLFGMEVAAALHKVSIGAIEEEAARATAVTDPGVVVAVVEVIAERFAAGEPTIAHDITDEIGVDERIVRAMLDALATARVVHWLDREDGTVTLAQPTSKIEVSTLLDVGFGLTSDASARRVPLLEKLRDAQRKAAEGTSVEALLAGRT